MEVIIGKELSRRGEWPKSALGRNDYFFDPIDGA